MISFLYVLGPGAEPEVTPSLVQPAACHSATKDHRGQRGVHQSSRANMSAEQGGPGELQRDVGQELFCSMSRV